MRNEQRSSRIFEGFMFGLIMANALLLIAIFNPSERLNLSRVIQMVDSYEIPVYAESSEPVMRLEWRIVDRYEEDEWNVEKYQEYEVYVDEENNIVEQTPTDHYKYLKYWRYE